jgi:hypothetical protein
MFNLTFCLLARFVPKLAICSGFDVRPSVRLLALSRHQTSTDFARNNFNGFAFKSSFAPPIFEVSIISKSSLIN